MCVCRLIRYIEPVPTDEHGVPLNDPSQASVKELKDLGDMLSDTQVRGHASRHTGEGTCWQTHMCGLASFV